MAQDGTDKHLPKRKRTITADIYRRLDNGGAPDFTPAELEVIAAHKNLSKAERRLRDEGREFMKGNRDPVISMNFKIFMIVVLASQLLGGVISIVSVFGAGIVLTSLYFIFLAFITIFYFRRWSYIFG